MQPFRWMLEKHIPAGWRPDDSNTEGIFRFVATFKAAGWLILAPGREVSPGKIDSPGCFLRRASDATRIQLNLKWVKKVHAAAIVVTLNSVDLLNEWISIQRKSTIVQSYRHDSHKILYKTVYVNLLEPLLKLECFRKSLFYWCQLIKATCVPSYLSFTIRSNVLLHEIVVRAASADFFSYPFAHPAHANHL